MQTIVQEKPAFDCRRLQAFEIPEVRHTFDEAALLGSGPAGETIRTEIWNCGNSRARA